jgi:hypothetical protein
VRARRRPPAGHAHRGRPGARSAAARLGLILLALSATTVRAQQPDSLPPAAPTADERVPRAEPLPIPEKPSVHQFRLSLEVNSFDWDDDAEVDDGLLVAFDVERDLAPFLAARGSLAYGVSEVRPRSGDGAARDVRLYLPEVVLLLQHTLRVSEQGRLTPYAGTGFGSLVADPEGEGSTRSQNAFSFGAGARFRFNDRLGVRGEVRRYLIKLEDPLDPSPQDSETVNAWRLGGAFSYAL